MDKVMKQMSELVVVKANEIIQAAYRLSLNEQRVILACISKVDSTKSLTKEDGITLKVSEVESLFTVGRGSFYNEVREATKRLYERSIVLDDDGSRRRWIYEVHYNQNAGEVTLFFSPTILPYLTQLRGNFTKYKLVHIANFSSSYAIRLYELLIQWMSKGEREVEIDWLKETLGVGSKYSRASNFFVRVIEPSMKDINSHSNISVQYGTRKTGRKITHIQFKFSLKKSKEKKVSKSKISFEEYVSKNAKVGESMINAQRRLSAEYKAL